MGNAKNYSCVALGILVLVAIAFWVLKPGQNEVPTKEAPAESAKPVKVGVLAPLSGMFASVGDEIRQGVSAVNADGIELVFLDTQCENAGALGAFQKGNDADGIRFFIGPACGSPQEVLAPLMAEREVLALIPSAASNKLFEASDKKMYQTQYSLEQDGRFVSQALLEAGHEKVAIITYQNAFSKVLLDSFKDSFAGEIATEVIIQDGASVLNPTELLRIKDSGAQAIYSTDIAFIFSNGLPKLRGLGIDLPLYSNYVTEFPSIREVAEGAYYSYPAGINTQESATYGLAKDTAGLFLPLVRECEGELGCVRQALHDSGKFDSQGIMKRKIILKQIQEGQAVAP